MGRAGQGRALELPRCPVTYHSVYWDHRPFFDWYTDTPPIQFSVDQTRQGEGAQENRKEGKSAKRKQGKQKPTQKSGNFDQIRLKSVSIFPLLTAGFFFPFGVTRTLGVRDSIV